MRTTAPQPPQPPAVTRPAPARVLLVDDHPIVRQGLAQLIEREADLSVCGEADTLADALDAVESLGPDVVLVDLLLRDNDDGFQLIKLLHARFPALPLLVLSMHKESLYAERALRAGARGYIMKHEVAQQVLAALRIVLGGTIYLSPAMSSRLVSRIVDPGAAADDDDDARPALERLSVREYEVFQLIGRGVGPTEIAARLGLSVRTVESYRESVKQKLGLRSGAQLTRAAIEHAINERR